MTFIVDDFVDRTELLTLMWQIARQEIDARVLVIESEPGMGKTYLLNRFADGCPDEDISVVCLDFLARYEDPGYMHVIHRIMDQLGLTGFDFLVQTILEMVCLSERSQTAAAAGTTLPQRPPEGPAAGAYINGDVNTGGGAFAGRDIVNYFQIIQHDDVFVRQFAAARITEALKACLVQLSVQRKIVFLIDHWQRADPDTRQWLADSLIKWVADLALPGTALMIASTQAVELNPRRRIRRVNMNCLAENDIYTYWVGIYGLPQDELPEIWKFTGGIPQILKMIAAHRSRVQHI